MDTKDSLTKLLEVESKSSEMLKDAGKEANALLAQAREDAARRSAESLKEAQRALGDALMAEKKKIDGEILEKIEDYNKYLLSLKPATGAFDTACLKYSRK